jgi:hypothetical protein
MVLTSGMDVMGWTSVLGSDGRGVATSIWPVAAVVAALRREPSPSPK